MKKVLLMILSVFGLMTGLFAQDAPVTYRRDLPEVTISSSVTLHFLSPEPISYVDISTSGISGDLPVKNILRLKLLADSLPKYEPGIRFIGVVTIVGESFIAQYNLCYSKLAESSFVPVQVEILPQHCSPLEVGQVSLTTAQLKQRAQRILDEGENKALRKQVAYGVKATLNHVYTTGELVFLDISFSNRTNLRYEIDELRFKIEDKKISKATNVQSLEISPIWQLYGNGHFTRRYRNVYVLKKATFPGSKVLTAELSEKQPSGRTITLKIAYSDILGADHI